MARDEVVNRIRDLLLDWIDDPECPASDQAEAVFDQIPISSCEISGEYSFSDLVRFAAHDVYRDTISTAR